jgi:DUF438 domain-containing protein
MSEHINNQAQRREVLKGLIRELHAGRTVEEVKGEFANLLRDVSATEIAAIEQALIGEGLPETEIKRLCDVHVAVFRESLDAQAKPESIPGHPLHTFRAENTAAEGVLEELRAALDAVQRDPNSAALQHARERLQAMREYDRHYLRKEYILFPYLEKHGFAGPSSVMWAIHDDVRAGWKALDALLTAGPGSDPRTFAAQVKATSDPLQQAIGEMFYKEEHILFPTALEKLSVDEWLAVRVQEPEYGYAYVQAGSEWPGEIPGMEHAAQPPASPAPVEAPAEPLAESTIPLHTGALTATELDALLSHLPIDLTFVGPDDAVRFFSLGKERIFSRSAAIIGRKVQKCHPPASVHRVQQILDAFRAGTRDVAEFWIQTAPGKPENKFVHIRYFAVRGPAGEYMGALEVVQDVTQIRNLQGQRRLLDAEG